MVVVVVEFLSLLEGLWRRTVLLLLLLQLLVVCGCECTELLVDTDIVDADIVDAVIVIIDDGRRAAQTVKHSNPATVTTNVHAFQEEEEEEEDDDEEDE